MVYAGATLAQAPPWSSAENTPVYTQRTDPREIILKLKDERGFKSDAALAAVAGIPQPTLSRYLNGKHATMSSQHLVQLAHALGATVSEVLGETPISSVAVREINAMLSSMSEPEQLRAARLLRALQGGEN